MDLGEGPQVVRTVNTMVIRIIENSDFTNMLRLVNQVFMGFVTLIFTFIIDFMTLMIFFFN